MRLFGFRDVRVGAAQTYVPYVLPYACSARYQHRARMRVGLTVGPEWLTVPALVRGELDLVIMGESPPNLACERLYDAYVLVVSELDRRLAAAKHSMLNVWKRPVFAVYRRSGSPSPALRTFIDDLKAIANVPTDAEPTV